MFCPNCGKPGSGAFCPHCGTRISQPQQPVNQEPQQPVYQQPVYIPQAPVGAATAVVQGAKAVGRAASRAQIIAILAAILAAIGGISTFLYIQFVKPHEPIDTIERLETALNELDTDAMLSCFDKQTQKLASGTLGVASDLIGIDFGAYADLAVGLGLMPTYKLDLLNLQEIDDDECLADLRITTSYMGETYTEDCTVPMQLVDRDWLIIAADGFSLLDELGY